MYNLGGNGKEKGIEGMEKTPEVIKGQKGLESIWNFNIQISKERYPLHPSFKNLKNWCSKIWCMYSMWILCVLLVISDPSASFKIHRFSKSPFEKVLIKKRNQMFMSQWKGARMVSLLEVPSQTLDRQILDTTNLRHANTRHDKHRHDKHKT